MAGVFLHENHTFVSLTPTMLLKMLYKIRPVWTGCRPVQDRSLFLVRSLPVAVRSFGQCEYIRTGPSPGLACRSKKPDRTGLSNTNLNDPFSDEEDMVKMYHMNT